jgi:hypothetical protein
MNPFFTISEALDYFELQNATIGDFPFRISSNQFFSVVFDEGFNGLVMGAIFYDRERTVSGEKR